ncbi:uncharacterized protein BO87DRAFT_164854 [Aspergillus neoniger CBS 115656]|uniref:Uncharacterized protein n=1 Tax=Aspergillus neoniger (strain CBS 115656) TaxID=1448310 RepID=A0A318YU20_ASPNB|nr:hypothetical protein BO87DRAFT_164854 [Aspergillus neoniger CBS 115656]PYH38261.1 hypothetical protein BO87DRAFT_164854 [Aspergillus neoniger CBS 115656]
MMLVSPRVFLPAGFIASLATGSSDDIDTRSPLGCRQQRPNRQTQQPHLFLISNATYLKALYFPVFISILL